MARKNVRPDLVVAAKYIRQLAAIGDKLDREGVDAVPCILGGHPLTEEDVSQVSAAILANNLGASSVRIRVTRHRVGDLVIKTGPATATVKLIV